LDPQFTGVCQLLIKLNTENNHICIRGFDNDPALRVLPGAHALSGCNTTSSFFGNGKNLVYKILKDAASDIHDLDNLRDPDKDVAISCSSRFVARLYDQKSFAIGKNLQPSLTLLTFPIWTHSSLVFVNCLSN
jgi:hypothetical protein